MTISPKVKTLLGFAKKSGKVISGETTIEERIKRNIFTFLFIASDMPDKRKKYWEKKCKEKNIKCYVIGTKEEYGAILGISPRNLLTVNDKQMAQAILEQLRLTEASLTDTFGGD